MYRNNLIIALRNFRKHRFFTFLNLAGLTISLTIGMLTLLYVGYELSYDRYHQQIDQLYRISVTTVSNGESVADASSENLVGPTLKESMPEVVDFARIYLEENVTLAYQDRHFKEEKLFVADPSFLSLFSWNFAKGDIYHALDKPQSIVLTTSAAKKYFGEQDPMGQTLTYRDHSGQLDLTVTGVMEDVPANSHIHFDMLISYATALEVWDRKLTWDHFDDYTYLLLAPDTDLKTLQKKAALEISRQNPQANSQNRYEWQPVKDIHLYSHKTYEAEANGSSTTVYALLAIFLLIIVIAWVNYINLTTVQSLNRMKESGIRKVLGASRKSLIFQFLTESLLLNFLSLILALLLVILIKPYFQVIVGHPLSFELWSRPEILVGLTVIIIAGTIGSSLFPTFRMTTFHPIAVLKKQFTGTSKGNLLRKSLVTFQFILSMMMIGGTLLVYRQITFLQQQETGTNMEQVLVVHAPNYLGTDSISSQRFAYFRNQVMDLPSVEMVSYSGALPGNGIFELSSTTGVFRQGQKSEQNIMYYIYGQSETYLETLDMTLIEGRNARPLAETGGRLEIVINETSLTRLGFQTPQNAIGASLEMGGEIATVVGVVQDYHHLSLKEEQIPFILFPLRESRATYYNLRLSPNQNTSYSKIISSIESAWNQTYPGDVFDYYFLNEQFNQQYQSDERFGKIFGIFTGFAIFIACLGLLGLATFAAKQRTKEIGIRKVLGASISSIMILLFQDYLKIILIAFLIATPLVNYFAQEWLNAFAYRIELRWWLFLLPGLAVLTIALLTISSQSLKAASQNPVDSLRSE